MISTYFQPAKDVFDALVPVASAHPSGSTAFGQEEECDREEETDGP